MVLITFETGLLTVVCVRLIRLLSYYLSSITMIFFISFVAVKLIVSLNIHVLNGCLFSSNLFMLFCLVYYDFHVG